MYRQGKSSAKILREIEVWSMKRQRRARKLGEFSETKERDEEEEEDRGEDVEEEMEDEEESFYLKEGLVTLGEEEGDA